MFFIVKCKVTVILLSIIFVFINLQICKCQLVINIKNKGGDIVQESITANTTDDTITLEFQRPEGTLITQFVDFKSEVQVFRVLILGEEERGQNAMSKLRQRNPGAVRQPEEDRLKEHLDMDLSIDLDKSSVVSPHLPRLCEEASHSTYAREDDLRAWASPKASLSRDIVSLTSAVKRSPPPKPVRCSESTAVLQQPCTCLLELCVGWYPCGLKYCRGKDSSTGRAVTYRCGIKTCRKCRAFSFHAKQKQTCLWDE